MKPEVDLELSISALRAYNVEPAVIKNMLDNLKKVVGSRKHTYPHCEHEHVSLIRHAAKCDVCEMVFETQW